MVNNQGKCNNSVEEMHGVHGLGDALWTYQQCIEYWFNEIRDTLNDLSLKTMEVIMSEIVLVANLSTKMFVISMIFNTLMVNHTKKTS